MRITITKSSKIYILAPGNVPSGGPEALHQLHYYLTTLGYKSRISYYSDPVVHPQFLIYEPKVIDIAEIQDSPDNILIVPEINTSILKNYSKIRKCIWFLGVQLYDGFETLSDSKFLQLKTKIVKLTPNFFLKTRQKILQSCFKQKFDKQPYLVSKKDNILCGSMFAYEFAKSNFKNVTLLVEPLGLGFLGENNVDLSSKNRSDSVLYNPSKNSKTLQKLLKRTDIIFKPISGYQDFELVDLFRNSKLYIDFGFFGGPERLPKETVLNGTMLLVGKRNASVNSFDIAIPDKYKIEDADDIEFIASKIKQMLLDYDQIIGDFRGFREKIINLEPNFIKSIKSIFIKA